MFEKGGYTLVAWKSLLVVLHRHCLTDGCVGCVDPEDTEISEQGAAVSITLCCSNNHKNTWHNSEFYPKKSEKGKARSKLNTQLSSYVLLTGLQFAPVEVGCEYVTILVKTHISVILQAPVNPYPKQRHLLECGQ